MLCSGKRSLQQSTDPTVLACPVNVHGFPGACHVLAALLGLGRRVLLSGQYGVQASTTAFLTNGATFHVERPLGLGDTPAGSGDTTAEIYLQDDTADTDLALQSEQRAMQELHRFQKLSLQVLEQPDDPPPIAPPRSVQFACGVAAGAH